MLAEEKDGLVAKLQVAESTRADLELARGMLRADIDAKTTELEEAAAERQAVE